MNNQIERQPVARIATVMIEHFPNGYTIRVTDNHGTEYRIDLRAALVGKKIARIPGWLVVTSTSLQLRIEAYQDTARRVPGGPVSKVCNAFSGSRSGGTSKRGENHNGNGLCT